MCTNAFVENLEKYLFGFLSYPEPDRDGHRFGACHVQFFFCLFIFVVVVFFVFFCCCCFFGGFFTSTSMTDLYF